MAIISGKALRRSGLEKNDQSELEDMANYILELERVLAPYVFCTIHRKNGDQMESPFATLNEICIVHFKIFGDLPYSAAISQRDKVIFRSNLSGIPNRSIKPQSRFLRQRIPDITKSSTRPCLVHQIL